MKVLFYIVKREKGGRGKFDDWIKNEKGGEGGGRVFSTHFFIARGRKKEGGQEIRTMELFGEEGESKLSTYTSPANEKGRGGWGNPNAKEGVPYFGEKRGRREEERKGRVLKRVYHEKKGAKKRILQTCPDLIPFSYPEGKDEGGENLTGTRERVEKSPSILFSNLDHSERRKEVEKTEYQTAMHREGKEEERDRKNDSLLYQMLKEKKGGEGRNKKAVPQGREGRDRSMLVNLDIERSEKEERGTGARPPTRRR